MSLPTPAELSATEAVDVANDAVEVLGLAGGPMQLSVFDDRQLIAGLPGTMFEGPRRTQNSTVNAKRRMIYTGSGPHYRVIAFTSSQRATFCVGLMGLIVRVTRGAPYLSLYRGEGKSVQLVLVGYNGRVLVLLQNLAFLVRRLG
jgi:hypothetical protein